MRSQSVLRVLLVEDNPGDARLIREYVKEDGKPWADVTWSETLAEGIAALSENRPDVVLLDLGLPDSAGLSSVKKIRGAAPLTPLVILTGLDDEELGVRAVAEGAQDYLVKGEVSGAVLKRVLSYSVERMGTLRAIRESEAKYQDLYENAPEMLISVDPGSGRILECNSTLTAKTGWTKGEVLGSRLLDLFHPVWLEERDGIFRDLAESGVLVGKELEIQTRDKKPLPVSLNVSSFRDGEGQILFHRFSLRDISKRREAEEALEASLRALEERSRISEIFLSQDDDSAFQEVLEEILSWRGCSLGFLGTLDPEGNLVVRAMNRSAWKACEMEEREVVLHRGRWERTLLGRAVATGSTQVENAGSLQLPEGHVPMKRVLASPVLEKERVVGILAMAEPEDPFTKEDLEAIEAVTAHLAPILSARLTRDRETERRRMAEERLKKLNQTLEERVQARTEELRRANEELQSFAYSVSHDLRGPLRAIDGYSGILEEDCAADLNSEGRRFLKVIRENTIRMAQLIDDLLEFSRVGRQEVRHVTVDMGALVGSVLEELVNGVDPVPVGTTVGELPSAEGDPNLLRQVWANLLSNSFKFSRNEGAPRVDVSGWQEDGEVVFCVKDNGAGFDMAYADKLFGVFERLHHPDEFEGTGVGLALVNRIVQRHGGRVWAEGEVGLGATFWFALPAHPGGEE